MTAISDCLTQKLKAYYQGNGYANLNDAINAYVGPTGGGAPNWNITVQQWAATCATQNGLDPNIPLTAADYAAAIAGAGGDASQLYPSVAPASSTNPGGAGTLPPPSPSPSPSPSPAPSPSPDTGILQELLDAFNTFVKFWTDLPQLAFDKWTAFLNGILPWWLSNVFAPVAVWFVNKRQALFTVIFGYPSIDAWGKAPGILNVLTDQNTGQFIADELVVVNRVMNSPSGILEKFVGGMLKIPLFFTVLLGSLEPLTVRIRKDAAFVDPQEPLDIASIIKLYRKGIFTLSEAQNLAKFHGIDNEDFINTINASNLTVPLSSALSWRDRGILDDGQLNSIFAASGIPSGDIPFYRAGSINLINPQTVIASNAKISARGMGYANQSIGSPVPSDIALLYTKASADPAQAQTDWNNHWNLPNFYSLISGFFRGIFSSNDLQATMLAESMPLELYDKLIESNRPLIPMRVAATLLSRGTIDLVKFTQIMAGLGWSQENIDLLAAYVVPKKVKPDPSSPGELSKLAVTSAAQLYENKAFTAEQFTDVLTQHGYSNVAAAAQVQLVDLKAALDDRKAQAQYLVNLVDLGQVTITDAVSALTTAGYTASEIVHYQKMMHRQKATTLKQPSYAQLVSMAKGGLITWADFENELAKLNYDPAWIGLLATLEGKPNG